MTKQGRSAANDAARDAAKHVLRRYGESTSALRRGPDFVIIGAKRGVRPPCTGTSLSTRPSIRSFRGAST